MARVSVEVPAELVRQIRETVLLLYQATAESLHHALRARGKGEGAGAEREAALDEPHLHRLRLDELDDIARRLESDERATQLSAPRDLLHDILYGALLDAGERLAEASNRCWRGELPLDRVQELAEEVLALDALLRELDE
jgi:Arc/MetJ-type ribon-helix-helix transcriptional regulator